MTWIRSNHSSTLKLPKGLKKRLISIVFFPLPFSPLIPSPKGFSYFPSLHSQFVPFLEPVLLLCPVPVQIFTWLTPSALLSTTTSKKLSLVLSESVAPYPDFLGVLLPLIIDFIFPEPPPDCEILREGCFSLFFFN